MSEFFEKILRILPEGIQKKIYIFRCNRWDPDLQKRILEYYKNDTLNNLTDEKREVIGYLERNPLNIFPYDFRRSYLSMKVKVFRDKNIDMLYVLLDNKRLYFKRGSTKDQIKRNVRWLQMEQDVNSPHRYMSKSIFVSDGDVVIDVGVAEGNFALSVVEKVKKMYLFEADKDWIEALNETFRPWGDKIRIINKFVSDKDDDDNVTLDSVCKKEERIDFIKVDVDGAERELLRGCNNLLSNTSSIKIALCTYHRQNDENDFSKFLLSKDFELEYSKGYMIYFHDKLEPPYLRRGLIRATKRVR
jgi:hypothetical protein